MSDNPAPEKVAALAAALDKHRKQSDDDGLLNGDERLIHCGEFDDYRDNSDPEGCVAAILAALNAAGWSLIRTEEGERLRAALERLELVGSTLARITADGDAVTPHPRTWHEFDAALEQARAALAASDEAARP